MQHDVYVAGVGMTPFGRHADATLKTLTAEAVSEALGDAGLGVESVELAFFANAIGGSITGQEMVAGQVALRSAGVWGIPVINVENACASASSAFNLAVHAVSSGAHEAVLAVGTEKMTHPDRRRSLAAIGGATDVEEVFGPEGPAASDRSYFMDLYAEQARAYLDSTDATVEDFARVAVKNQRHGAANPRAQYGSTTITVAEVLAARGIVTPLTLPMCSPVSDGSAAVVLVGRDLAARLDRQRVAVAASVITSGTPSSSTAASAVARATARAFERAGFGPEDLDLVELHDATASAELALYEDLGLCDPGGAAELIRHDRTTFGGSVCVNPSGGLLAKGHPIGATGIAQIVEATDQLLGRAPEARRVVDARWALAQNGGGWLDGDNAAAAVTILTST